MEYVVGVLFGMALLGGLLLFRRKSRHREEPVGFFCMCHTIADGSEVRYQIRFRPPSTDHLFP